MHGRANVVNEARQGQFSRSGAAADRIFGLVDNDGPPGPRNRNRRSETVRPRPDDDCIRLAFGPVCRLRADCVAPKRAGFAPLLERMPEPALANLPDLDSSDFAFQRWWKVLAARWQGRFFLALSGVRQRQWWW